MDRYQSLANFDSIKLSLLLAVGAGILFLLLVQCAPTLMVYLSVTLGGLSFVALGVLLTIFGSGQYDNLRIARIIIGALFIMFGIILVLALCLLKKDLKLCALFLKYAGLFIRNNYSVLLTIPVFLLFTASILALFLFQLLAFWSCSEMQFSPSTPFYQPSRQVAIILTVLDFAELYCALSFVKEASKTTHPIFD